MVAGIIITIQETNNKLQSVISPYRGSGSITCHCASHGDTTVVSVQ